MTVLELVIVISGAIGALITTLCYNVRRSRCNEINICWGCMDCTREVMTAKDMKADQMPNNMASNSVYRSGPSTVYNPNERLSKSILTKTDSGIPDRRRTLSFELEMDSPKNKSNIN